MKFDAAGAKAAGYSDAEIADFLASEAKFDAVAARKSGYTDAEIVQHLQPKEESKPLGSYVKDYVSGLLPGAGAIGSTLVELSKTGPKGYGAESGSTLIQRIKDRNNAIGQAVSSATGADRESIPYKAGEITSQIAGTAGLGPAMGVGAKAAGAGPAVVDALGSGGFSVGGAKGLEALLLRLFGGGVTGAAQVGVVDPENVGVGAGLGAALPVAVRGAGALGNAIHGASESASKRLMQSAIKPTIKQLQTGEADVAAKTLLDYGLNPTKGGVEKLKQLIDTKNTEIADAIANSGAVIDKQNVVNALGSVRQRFGNQVSPTADLGAIQKVADDFLMHPNMPGSAIPVQQAQAMKQGTYQVLAKKYGQLGSAETEAQKGLARGLKEEIASAVPGVQALNAEESRLIQTLKVAERRSLMELNKNPMGLALLANNPASWAAFMADKSALFKSLAARSVNRISGGTNAAGRGLLGAAGNPVIRSGGLLAVESNP